MYCMYLIQVPVAYMWFAMCICVLQTCPLWATSREKHHLYLQGSLHSNTEEIHGSCLLSNVSQ